MSFSANADGWISMPGPDGADGLHVRARERDGRMVITDLYVHAAEITPDILRGLSVRQLEATLNAATRLEPGQYSVAVMLASVAANFARTDTGEPSLTELRDRARRKVQRQTTSPERPRLTRPDGATPEEFYPRVAAAYHEYTLRTRSPAKEIAGEASVPVTTAHRWIREARRRGFLQPARKGKAT